ncbi:hypothetical protein [Streptomyces sp. NPDC060002]|uniref:hypothetical protein n=1 Tax=Streptomyces sp. NPDC060002 TaxID=3347033 RepID=UPI0036808E3C
MPSARRPALADGCHEILAVSADARAVARARSGVTPPPYLPRGPAGALGEFCALVIGPRRREAWSPHKEDVTLPGAAPSLPLVHTESATQGVADLSHWILVSFVDPTRSCRAGPRAGRCYPATAEASSGLLLDNEETV